MKKRGKFKYIYLLYLFTLLILAVAAVLYVSSLLRSYEEAQPEKRVYEAIDKLIIDSRSGKLWSDIGFDKISVSKYEAGRDLKGEYTDMLSSDDLTIAKKAGGTTSSEQVYTVKKDGFTLAEVHLKAVGDPITRLAVFSWTNWEIADIKATFDSHKYTVSIPIGYHISLGGVAVNSDSVTEITESEIKYTIENIFLPPNFKITSDDGSIVNYTLKGDKVLPQIYNYSITLPNTVSVKLNGDRHTGELLDNGHEKHSIVTLTEPEIIIEDLYGNSIVYAGESTVPLTYMTLKAPENFRVTADGKEIPDSAITLTDNPEYTGFAEFAKDLPRLAEYSIAILKDNAEIITVTTDGTELKADTSLLSVDYTDLPGSDIIPEKISIEVNPLEVAEKWSMFVSNDIEGPSHGFGEISQHLIKGSYQYSIATKYANGIDITFTSIHTLMDPPFRNEKVVNFRQITENCFSVDISFDKHMKLYYGKEIIDSMNERWYFLKYSENENTPPTWRLAAMKEVGANGK
ncbi:MAG: hypothetical protein IKT70_06710 [Clostridia bacterium]|nr:hypothetical protein [Clostridia bacterium]